LRRDEMFDLNSESSFPLFVDVFAKSVPTKTPASCQAVSYLPA